MNQTTLLDCLLIEPTEFSGKHINITENHGADASWALSSLLANRLSRGDNVCLIIFHHTFGHFHNCCVRLGINLILMQKEKRLTIIEGSKLIMKMQDLNHPSLLNTIYTKTHEALDSLAKPKESHTTFIAIDDVSALSGIGCSIGQILHLISQFRSHIFQLPNLTLITGTHVSDESTRTLANALIHQSDAAASISPLKTGPSRQVHGRIEIDRQGSHRESKVTENFTVLTLYHFQVKEQDIKIFAPGSILAR